jgi:hypothetical protein
VIDMGAEDASCPHALDWEGARALARAIRDVSDGRAGTLYDLDHDFSVCRVGRGIAVAVPDRRATRRTFTPDLAIELARIVEAKFPA